MEPETHDHPAIAAEIEKTKERAENRGVFLIAVFDLVKAVFFLVAAAGIFHLVDRNTHVELTRLLHVFRLRGDHEFVRGLLLKADVITDSNKRILTGVLLLYAGMYTVEGIGLLLRKRWAEYFAVLMTVIPLPFEMYTLWHHATYLHSGSLLASDPAVPVLLHSQVFVLKFAVLIINAGIVWYLFHHLQSTAKLPGRVVITQN